jgi:hypothetical protein
MRSAGAKAVMPRVKDKTADTNKSLNLARAQNKKTKIAMIIILGCIKVASVKDIEATKNSPQSTLHFSFRKKRIKAAIAIKDRATNGNS